jgi:hypothetical protein
MIFMNRNIYKNQKGQALVSLLAFVAIALVITSAAVIATLINSQGTSNYAISEEIFALGETGLETAVLRLLRNPNFTSAVINVGSSGETQKIHNTKSDFDGGVLRDRVITTNLLGGELQLEGWTAPAISGTAAVTTGRSMFVSGNHAYVGMLANAGTEFRIYDISTPASPSLLGGLELGVDVNDISVSGNFAYLATSDSLGEFKVIDISNPASPTSAASLDLAGTVAAKSVSVNTASSTAYIGRLNNVLGAEFFVADISNPLSPTISGSLELGANINQITYFSGNFAYLATGSDTGELVVVNVSNPASPASAGTFDATGTQDALSVFATTTAAVFLGRVNVPTGPELLILNASNPASITSVGTFEVGGDVNNVFATSSIAFIGTGVANQQLKIVGIYDYTAPTLFANLSFGNTVYRTFFRDQHVFLVTNANFRTVVGDAAGNFFPEALFESATIDTGAVSNFNLFSWSASTSAVATVKFQIALNSDNATWNYVGPDGTASTFYTSPGNVPASLAINRYFRYKGFLTGNANNTPSIDYVAINYLPQDATSFVTILVTGSGSSRTINVKAATAGFVRKFEAAGSFTGTVFTVTSWKEIE